MSLESKVTTKSDNLLNLRAGDFLKPFCWGLCDYNNRLGEWEKINRTGLDCYKTFIKMNVLAIYHLFTICGSLYALGYGLQSLFGK